MVARYLAPTEGRPYAEKIGGKGSQTGSKKSQEKEIKKRPLGQS